MSNIINNIGFTSQQDWDVEPETSTKVPKDLTDQVASTQIGRVMQLYAGEVVENRDRINSLGFPGQESDEYDYEAGHVESGRISMDANGFITINEKTTIAELKNMKEILLDRKLNTDSEKRKAMLEETNSLIARIDAAIASKETIEAIESVDKAPESITEALRTLRVTRNKETLIVAAFQLLDGFNALRANDPDKMVELADELQSRNGSMTAYEEALVDFVKTHNSFTFSDKIQKELSLAVLREYDDTEDRNYAQPLLAAYNSQVDEDDPRTFATEVLARNGFRKDAFQRYVDFNLAN